MASITGERIRELKGRDKARPLIFQPKTDLQTALERHTEAYQWLGADRKPNLSPKLWRDLIDFLSPIPTKKARQTAYNAFIAQEWENPRYRSFEERKAIQTKEEQEKGLKEFEAFSKAIKTHGIFEDYSEHYCRTKLLPKFPGDKKAVEEIQYQLIRGNGPHDDGLGLFLDKYSKVPKPFYARYLDSLTSSEAAQAKKLVRHIQDIARYGSLWEDFFKAQGITIQSMDDTHCEYYPAWRKENRLPSHGSKGLEKPSQVGASSLKKEINFFKQVCRYGLIKKVITSDPSLSLNIKVERKILTDKEKPLDLDSLETLLGYLDTVLADSPNEESLLNIKSIYFLLLTGCRPSEINHYVIDGDLLHLNPNGTGKTKQAVRSLPLTPKLREIALDPVIGLNKDSIDVSKRIYQWLKRRNHKVNPYRFRHTCATILLVNGEIPLQEIAYRMGHSDAGFTQRVYGNMGVHLKKGDKKAVKAFWDRLNGL